MIRVFRATLAMAAYLPSTAALPQQAGPPSSDAPQADTVQSGTLGKAGANQEAPKTPDAVRRTHYNGRVAQALVLATSGSRKPDSDYAMELYHGVHAIRGVVLRPDLQYVIDPGGYAHGVTDVAVIGGRFDINFQPRRAPP